MSKVPKSLTTVTLFSKILATILLVFIIPMASFYAGMQYERAATIAGLELPTLVTHSQEVQSAAEKSVRDYLTKYTLSSTLPSQRLKAFRIYHPQYLSESGNTILFHVTITVEPSSKQADTFWLTGNGVLMSDGWISGKIMQVKAVRNEGIYQITTITPAK